MYRILTFLFLLIAFSSCEPELTNDFSFLEGSWKAQLNDSNYILESWKKENEHLYTALTYEVSDSGMILSEEIKIELTDSGTFYKPTIEALAGGAHEFSYLFESQEDNTYTFKNMENKVSVIWYKFIDENHMEAGIQKEIGKNEFVLSFEKVKP